MSTPLRPAALVLALALAGCGTQTSPGTGTVRLSSSTASTAVPTTVPAATGTVTGVATILQGEDDPAPMACLGPVRESLPPQCSGPQVVGLDWADVPHDDARGVRWTDPLQVTGTWDGTRLTLTSAPGAPRPIPVEPPTRTTSREGEGMTEQEALRIQTEIGTLDLPGLLTSTPGSDTVLVAVVHDDGSIQRALDARYGAGTVTVTSALDTTDPSGTTD